MDEGQVQTYDLLHQMHRKKTQCSLGVGGGVRLDLLPAIEPGSQAELYHTATYIPSPTGVLWRGLFSHSMRQTG